jgi:predicted PhzF superfamily epimerase YddE/YHI9
MTELPCFQVDAFTRRAFGGNPAAVMPLTPLWAARLGKTTLRARQVSARTGELGCTLAGERVRMSGHARLTKTGVFLLP